MIQALGKHLFVKIIKSYDADEGIALAQVLSAGSRSWLRGIDEILIYQDPKTSRLRKCMRFIHKDDVLGYTLKSVLDEPALPAGAVRSELLDLPEDQDRD